MITESRINQIEAAALDYIEALDPKQEIHHVIAYLCGELRYYVGAHAQMTLAAYGGWIAALVFGLALLWRIVKG